MRDLNQDSTAATREDAGAGTGRRPNVDGWENRRARRHNGDKYGDALNQSVIRIFQQTSPLAPRQLVIATTERSHGVHVLIVLKDVEVNGVIEAFFGIRR
jgi:hypothetical protein